MCGLNEYAATYTAQMALQETAGPQKHTLACVRDGQVSRVRYRCPNCIQYFAGPRSLETNNCPKIGPP